MQDPRLGVGRRVWAGLAGQLLDKADSQGKLFRDHVVPLNWKKAKPRFLPADVKPTPVHSISMSIGKLPIGLLESSDNLGKCS